MSDAMTQKHEEMLQKIKEFRLLDDDFMTKCFEANYEAVELVLQIVLEKPDINIEKIQTQYSMKNMKGRSLRLDIFATDSAGKKYNIEIQRADKGAGAKRARYNSSLIDSDILPAGFDVDNLAETFVIFITENDVIGKNKPIYHVDRYIREAEEYFGDGSHIIYVNAAYEDDTELGKLMHDFKVANPNEMYFKVLADTARYFKQDEEGVRAMCKAMEELIDKEKKELQLELAFRMMKAGKYTKLEVMDIFEITEEEYEELSRKVQLV
ncbi:MAG: PD-(D/E)XK nuclease family transposase [Lachnospiraceae bacterium]